MQKINYKFSIIISHLNEGYLLNVMLDSFYNYINYRNYEIIIVDDGSDNLSHLDFLKNHFLKDKIKLFFVNRLGTSKNRNFGANKATGDFLFFTDAHMYIKDDILEKINIKLNENKKLQAFQISIGVLDDKNIEGNSYILGRNSNDLSPNYLYFLDKYKTGIVKIPTIAGACFIIEKRLFSTMGGFCKLLNGYGEEDIYLSLKLWFTGYPCYKIQDININHRFRESFYNYNVDVKNLIFNKLIVFFLFFNNTRLKNFFEKEKNKYGTYFDQVYKELINNNKIMNFIKNEKKSFIINDSEYFKEFETYFINK